jgi:uncharacterized delta-60 repeat protein
MISSALFRLFALANLIFGLMWALPELQAAPGDPDTTHVSIGGGTVLTTVVQPDGKILIGGSFTTVLGVTRNRIARLNANGSLDKTFNPNANGTVESIVVQRDGRILIGGFFTTLQPASKGAVIMRRHIARLLPNGALDLGFAPDADREVLSMVAQADGKIVIGGRFDSLLPNGAAVATARQRIARLHPDGSLDPGFSPMVGGDVYTLTLQADEMILLAGNFSMINASTRAGCARLHADGRVDTGFRQTVATNVNSLAVQADGKILLGGDFGIARLNRDGSQDMGFRPNANGRVYSMALQADARMVIAGFFTSLHPAGAPAATSRRYIARLHPDGTVDMGFNPSPNDFVGCVALQADGKVLLAGGFSSLLPNLTGSSTARAGFARLHNDSASQGISATTNSQVTWRRGGSAPDVAGVTFELSTNKGKSWSPLGAGQRVGATGHWQLTGLALPANGRLRARGSTRDANGSNGGLIESMLNYSRLAAGPEIAVFNGAGTAAADELLDDEGTLILNTTARTITVSNTGSTDLTGLAVTLAGSHPGDFALIPPPTTTLAPGATTSFTLAHAPAALGVRDAVVNIASNDRDEPVFRIKIANLAPEIAVKGNGTDITNGDFTPATTDGTDFGNVQVAAGSITRSFTLSNSGGADLTFGPVTVGGVHAADFVLESQPLSPIPAGRSRSFSIRFTPGGPGPRQATVLIGSNDADETEFSFGILGTGFLSSNADLSGLSLSTGHFAPSFGPGLTSYTAAVPHGDGHLAIRPTAAGAGAEIHVRMNAGTFFPVESGSLSQALPLDVGPNELEIRVVAQDGASTRTYGVTVTRAAASAGDCDPWDAGIAGGGVMAVAVQADGKTIVAGEFISARDELRFHLVRFNPDGTVDAGFDPMPDAPVSSVAIQEDGKVLIGGSFSSLLSNGSFLPVTRHRIARLHPDGTLDSSFDPAADADVSCIAVQADGKILIGGSFTTLQPNGAPVSIPRSRMARLNADGTVDADFDPNPDGVVSTIALQPDGGILIGGSFHTLQPHGAAVASQRSYLARLHPDGTLDSGFDPKPNNHLSSLVVQADGKVVLGGHFTALRPNGAAVSTTRRHLARVQGDGTLDLGFDPSADGQVHCLALQANGQILVGGSFLTLRPDIRFAANPRNRIARLNEDGTLDFGFNPRASNSVHALALQADGRILVGGHFLTLRPNGASGDTARAYLARLINHPATQSLAAPDASRVNWTRGGSSPEVSQVTFELSTDGGSSYAPLGQAERLGATADWQLAGLSLPASGQIRARGRTTDGSSSGLVETVTAFSGLAQAIEGWRQTHFGSPANTGRGADDFDADHDGLANLIEYAFGLNPLSPDAGQLPRPERSGGNLTIHFTRPAGVSGISYRAEWSENLRDWTAVADSGTAPQHRFSLPTAGRGTLFLRLNVGAP